MKIQFNNLLMVIVLLIPVFNLAEASELEVPNVFIPGTRVFAADINANFDATAVSVNDNHARLDTLLSAVGALQATVDSLQAENKKLTSDIVKLEAANNAISNAVIPGLKETLSVELDAEGQPTTVIFSGINLVLNNGNDDKNTGVVNGRGNLIVGFNEPNEMEDLPEVCSDPHYSNEDCESNGATLAVNHRSGSHNIIVGPGHSYSQSGGLVVGSYNRIIGVNASITGGTENLALGNFSSISGGKNNQALEEHSSVSGGRGNMAIGEFSSLSGGSENQATGRFSSVSGGRENIASGSKSSISGGESNRVEGRSSSITGGEWNKIPSDVSYGSISGGAENKIYDDHSWRVSDDLSAYDWFK